MKTFRLLIILAAAAAALGGCIRDKIKPETKTYTVTVTATGSGTAEAEPAKAAEGETVKLTAQPDDGYLFVRWTVLKGELVLEDPAENPIMFKMPAEDVAIEAEFEENIDVFTKITDPVFLEYCQQFDTNGDGKLLHDEVIQITDISIYNTTVASVAGIEYFTELETLVCRNTPITSLDVSRNTLLEYLDCRQCGLNTLDISQNKELTTFACSENNLTTLDVTANTKLEMIYCDFNELTTIDLSQNTALTYFQCFANQMDVLDASNMALDENGGYTLYCGQQRTVPGGSVLKTLTLTLREDMKAYWGSVLKNDSFNNYIMLAD